MEKKENGLKENCASTEMLRNYLTNKGEHHVRYKTYSRMKYTQSALTYKALFFSDGHNWNDTKDRLQMSGQCAFAKCFQYMVSENVANWMLYGGHGGKEGAMLDIPKKVMMNIKGAKHIQLGHFEEGAGFVVQLEIDDSDFSIDLIDVVYGKDGNISRADEFAKVSPELVTDKFPIFYKSYPWSYERECRMVITVDKKYKDFISDNGIDTAGISLADEDVNILKENFYSSPVFKNIDMVDLTYAPRESVLKGEVEWDIDK